MAEIMRLRQFSPDPDSGWQHNDVAVDGEGTWLRRTEDGLWLMFGEPDPFDDDDVAGPVTLIAHAGETTDLARARRIAMVFADENAALRDLAARTAERMKQLVEAFPLDMDEVADAALTDIETTIAALDPLRADS